MDIERRLSLNAMQGLRRRAYSLFVATAVLVLSLMFRGSDTYVPLPGGDAVSTDTVLIWGAVGGSLYILFILMVMFLENAPRIYGLEAGSLAVRLSNDENPPPTDIVPSPTAPAEAMPLAPAYDKLAEEMRWRLRVEIGAQGSRASLNLALGGISLIAAIGVLIWLAGSSTSALTSAVQERSAYQPPMMLYWGSFASKIALSITANIFAFFFLATYRRTLNDIKYFQNEITNVESHLIALYLARESGKPQLMQRVIQSLVAIERNFILRKGESTADLSAKNLDNQEVQALASLLASKLASGPPESK